MKSYEEQIVETEEFYANTQLVIDAIDKAARTDTLAVVDATLKATGEPVRVLVATMEKEEATDMLPLALLFNGSPYLQINPPEGAYLTRLNEDGTRQRLDN